MIFSGCDGLVMMLLISSCADSLLNSLQSLTTEVSNLREHNLHICRENAVSHVKTYTTYAVYPTEREEDSWSRLRPLAWLL